MEGRTRRASGLRDVLFSALDVSFDQHLVQACLDDCLDQPTVVSSNGLCRKE